MKYFFTTIAIALIAFGYYTFYYKPLVASPPTATPVLTLSEIPSDLCPEKIRLLITAINDPKPLTDRLAPVKNCRTVLIKNYLPALSGEYSVFIKLPKSLASSVVLNAPLTRSVVMPVRLGDLNEDNVIDSTDERLVTEALYSVDDLADINGDGKVSIDDVVIVRLNKGVGADRPDGKPWSKVE
jgi:hypothetical protein